MAVRAIAVAPTPFPHRPHAHTARATFQAFVLYAFFQLMLSFLGGREKLGERLRARPKDRAHSMLGPCGGRGWKMGPRFVHRATVGVYQYVFLRVIVSVMTLGFQGAGLYAEGAWCARNVYTPSPVQSGEHISRYAPDRPPTATPPRAPRGPVPHLQATGALAASTCTPRS